MTQPAIAFPEMQKSILVLFDMAAFYLPLHAQNWKDFFSYYPILGMVEGLIYQVEVAMEAPDVHTGVGTKGPNLWPEKEPVIRAFLAEHQLDQPAILRYLTEVGDYFQIAHHLLTTDQPDHADVIRAAETRPTDIRLLHAILLQLMGQPHDEALFDLLWSLEVLLDLKANLTEYTDDLITGHYNTYQKFVLLYGEEAPHYMAIEQQRYQRCLQEKLAGASKEDQTRLQQFMAQHEEEYPSVAIPMPVISKGGPSGSSL